MTQNIITRKKTVVDHIDIPSQTRLIGMILQDSVCTVKDNKEHIQFFILANQQKAICEDEESSTLIFKICTDDAGMDIGSNANFKAGTVVACEGNNKDLQTVIASNCLKENADGELEEDDHEDIVAFTCNYCELKASDIIIV